MPVKSSFPPPPIHPSPPPSCTRNTPACLAYTCSRALCVTIIADVVGLASGLVNRGEPGGKGEGDEYGFGEGEDGGEGGFSLHAAVTAFAQHQFRPVYHSLLLDQEPMPQVGLGDALRECACWEGGGGGWLRRVWWLGRGTCPLPLCTLRPRPSHPDRSAGSSRVADGGPRADYGLTCTLCSSGRPHEGRHMPAVGVASIAGNAAGLQGLRTNVPTPPTTPPCAATQLQHATVASTPRTGATYAKCPRRARAQGGGGRGGDRIWCGGGGGGRQRRALKYPQHCKTQRSEAVVVAPGDQCWRQGPGDREGGACRIHAADCHRSD